MTFKRFPMAFRLAIIALENKSFEMPIVDLFTTMTSLASLNSSSRQLSVLFSIRKCLECHCARRTAAVWEANHILPDSSLSLSTTNLLGSNDSAQLSTEILYACARCSARQQKWALHTIFCVNSFYKIAPCLPCLLVNNHYHQQNPFLHNGGIKFLQAK